MSGVLMQLLAYGSEEYLLEGVSDNDYFRDLRLNDIWKKIKGLKKLKTLFYCWKFKAKMVDWMWRAKDRIVQRDWHPDRMRERLEACGGDLELLFNMI